MNSISPPEVPFRRIEFMIQETSKYDKSVGTRVNVLEVLPDKRPHWLQNFTCAAM